MDVSEGEQGGIFFLSVVAAQWLWYRTRYWHRAAAAEWRASLFRGEGREGSGVFPGSCVEPPIYAAATGFGWKGALVGLQHAVWGTLGPWCVTHRGGWASPAFVTEAYVSELDYWFLWWNKRPYPIESEPWTWKRTHGQWDRKAKCLYAFPCSSLLPSSAVWGGFYLLLVVCFERTGQNPPIFTLVIFFFLPHLVPFLSFRLSKITSLKPLKK